MPEHVPHQIGELVTHLSLVNWHALTVAAVTLAIVYGWPRLPGKFHPASSRSSLRHCWQICSIGTKFGGIPAGFPGWHIPAVSLQAMRELIGPAFTIAILGAIESLLSAMVADGMTDTRHDSNQELIGQGVANLIAPLFGGIAATGAIARTAANIRSGGQTPVSGMIHALVLLAVALMAAPLAQYIPLACLSAILVSVALRMGDWHTFVELWRGPKSDFSVLLAAFSLTVVFDLTVGVGLGLVMAAVLFVRRMEEIVQIKLVPPETEVDGTGNHSLAGKELPPGGVLYRIEGPFFFAAVEKLEMALRASGGKPRAAIFRMRLVPAIDASGLRAFEIAIEKLRRDGVKVF